ncbi:hypothetical protein Tco_1288127 [Tanacetum coccineum]
MTDVVHAPAMAPPVRTDEQILPRIRWASSKNRGAQSTSINSGDTICFDSKAGSYKCQLDEQWFDLSQDTLRDALQITPVDKNRAFSPPPTPDTLIKFVNELGYPREVINLSMYKLNRNLFQTLVGTRKQSSICALRESHQDLKDQGSPSATDPLVKIEESGTAKLRKEVIFKVFQRSRGPNGDSLRMTLPNESSMMSFEELIIMKLILIKGAKHQTIPCGLEDTEEAILQKVLQESLTDAYPTQRGPLPPMVFRETDTGKFQPLPEVPGKGKEKVGEEQAAQVLLNLQTPKKKSPAEQYIFQRRSHIPSETAGREDSTSLYAELGLSGSDTESDEEMPSVVRSGAQDEGQAGPDPGTLDEGQAGPNPDDVAESQPLPTPSVLAGPNLEHSDVEIIDPSSQPQPEHMDEGFTATAYPEVQENLKLTVDEQMIPEEPVSSTGTLSSLRHLTKDFSYGDQFIDDKPSEANYEKTIADTEAESMVSVTI